ncbi:MAG: hemerythrin domain-containing protein, partial [bacterium]
AEWEEAVLYPAIDRLAGVSDPPLTATMRREHQFVGGWMAELQGFRSASPPDTASFARVADNMLSFIAAHFAVQEDVLLPVLDRTLTPEEFQREILDRTL